MPVRLVAALLALLVLRADAQSITFLGPSLDLEVQGWWTPAAGGETMHMHLGSRNSPLYQRVSGNVAWDTTLKLHLADGRIGALSSTFAPTLSGVLLRGIPTSVVEERSFQIVSDTTRATSDGWARFRVQSVFTDARDNMKRLVRLAGWMNVVNGKPLSDARAKELRASSWISPSDFEGRGYSTVHLHQADFPVKPVGGVWRPRVMIGSSKSGQRRHLFASIDPDFHNGHKGQVVLEQLNASKTWITLSIDTRRFQNGLHKLFVKGSDAGMFPSGTLEAALAVGFTVAN